MSSCSCEPHVRQTYGTRKTVGVEVCNFCNQQLTALPAPTPAADVAIAAADSGSERDGRKTFEKVPAYAVSDDNFRAVIAAQDRTTHAVRALVRFILIQVASLSVGAILIGVSAGMAVSTDCAYYGNCSDGSLTFIGYLVIVAGFIWASIAASQELDRSGRGLEKH